MRKLVTDSGGLSSSSYDHAGLCTRKACLVGSKHHCPNMIAVCCTACEPVTFCGCIPDSLAIYFHPEGLK